MKTDYFPSIDVNSDLWWNHDWGKQIHEFQDYTATSAYPSGIPICHRFPLLEPGWLNQGFLFFFIGHFSGLFKQNCCLHANFLSFSIHTYKSSSSHILVACNTLPIKILGYHLSPQIICPQGVYTFLSFHLRNCAMRVLVSKWLLLCNLSNCQFLPQSFTSCLILLKFMMVEYIDHVDVKL